MAVSERYFVEWKEQYVSKERGNRVVHYFLKDNSGESILAVVGTERSVRHMFYVVSEEFLSAHGADSSAQASFRWRSRREVVNWLTSMLSKQHRRGDYAISHKDHPTSELNFQQNQLTPHKDRLAKNLKGRHSGISWSGSSWVCGKQLKHYPSFSRNGISIGVNSLVFVMAEKENHYIAYLEDMYEDKKCQKKVKVRWFHHNKEVQGVVSLQDLHPKEVFITPYVQVISAECVDGPAIVLTREHFEKCVSVFPQDLLSGIHFCFRQFKSNRVKPFKLSKLQGYFDQPIFQCFNPDFFDDKELSSEDDVEVGAKRSRSSKEFNKSRYDLSYKKCRTPSDAGGHIRHASAFTMNDKVEFLSQDSGLRGCWFRCTILEVTRRQTKILYDDVKDEDSGSSLEEWIPTVRVVKADKLRMRHEGRLTVRPAYPFKENDLTLTVGDPADAWWCDGWWEGVVSGTNNAKNGVFQIYIPGENLYLDTELKNIRVSRDYVGDEWVDIEPNPNILSIISGTTTDSKLSTPSALSTEAKSDNSPIRLCTVEEEGIHHGLADMTLTNVPLKDDCMNNEAEEKEAKSDNSPVKLCAIEEEDIHGLAGMTLTNVPLEDECINKEQQKAFDTEEKVSVDCFESRSHANNSCNGFEDNDESKRNGIVDDDNNLVECEIAEMDCEAEAMEMSTNH